MSSAGSVTHWISQIKTGDQAAAQPLWERYFQRLVGLARKKLQGTARRAADEEDAALSAFDSFCRGAERGRFPQLQDRDDLWHLLVVITARKAFDQIQHERRQKRGAGDVLDEAAVARPPDASTLSCGLEQVVGTQPTPDFAAQVAEECRRLLAHLGDEELNAIALWKMEGFTTEEIAHKLSCAVRTVERKLRRIRSIWQSQMGRE